MSASSTVVKIIISLLSITITNSRALQDSTTQNCNYAVDIWSLTASPPSPSPTPEPTNEPTESPTSPPTNTNQTVTLPIDSNYYDLNYASGSSGSSDMGIIFLLNPYRMKQCYNLNFTSEPFNEVAWKYTCKDSTTLKREIWWDSLECTGTADELTEISENERGPWTQFICDAPTDCAYADITLVPAITMSPTPEPTDEPTPNPTPYPSTPNVAIHHCDYGILNLCDYGILPNVTCQCDEECQYRSPYDCCDDYHQVCHDFLEDRAESSRGGDNSYVQCDNENGAQSNAETMYHWIYGTNICVSMLDFYGIFLDGENITEFNGTVMHIGWQCVAGSYYMALFNGSDCTSEPVKYIQYSDDKCAFAGSAWATVSCSEDWTPPPTPKPTTTKPPTVSPTTSNGCRRDCTDDEICVVTTGECETKIVEQKCQNDNECIGDDFYCKKGKFCYFSECDNDKGCERDVGVYECDKIEAKEGSVEYEYGICKEIVVGSDDSNGVGKNSIMIAIALLVAGLIFSVQL